MRPVVLHDVEEYRCCECNTATFNMNAVKLGDNLVCPDCFEILEEEYNCGLFDHYAFFDTYGFFFKQEVEE